MNFIKKKKKGSSLLIVVAMMAVVSIITISVLTMTTSGYKMRKDSNKRVENFYGADSGLEISERILIGFIDAAIDNSNQVVDDMAATKPIDEKNRVFKESFIKFFQNGGNSDIKPFYKETKIMSYAHLDYKPIVDELKVEEYYTEVNRDDINIYDTGVKYKSDKEIEVNHNEYEKIKIMTVNVKSEYEKNEKVRSVGVDFDITVPTYGKKIEKVNSGGAPKILDYIIGVDGDFDLNIGTAADFYGDIWVKGNTKEILTAENKYEGGVTIATLGAKDTAFEINGGILTGGTLNLVDVDFKIQDSSNKDIYANNVKLDNVQSDSTNSMNLKTKDLYVYNDLVLNGESNKLSAANYYGINDINEYEESDFSLDEADRSSSIIINTDLNSTKSSINIANDSYILGTSYIDLEEGKPYQTGQSNSVNSFSRPYTVRSERQYIYDYNGTLHLIDTKYDGSELSIEDKVEIVKNYKNSMTEEEKKMSSILSSKNFYNTGAIYGNETSENNNGLILPDTPVGVDVNKLQTNYAREVFNMGQEGSDITQFWNKEFSSSVEESFAWSKFSEVIDKLDTSKATLIAKNMDSTVGVFDINIDIGRILHKAHHDPMKPNIIAYATGHVDWCSDSESLLAFTDFDRYKARILLLEGKDKELIINEVDHNFKGPLIDKDITGKKIIYNLKPDYTPGNGTYDKYPLLVISEGDVELPNIKSKNYIQVITAGDFSMNAKAGAGILGNYAVGSSEIDGYAGGQFNFLNELFKYILTDNDIMGDIGEEIFVGKDSMEVTESIEISDVIETNNWEIIK